MQFIGTVDAAGKLDPDVRTQIADYIRTWAGYTIDVTVRKYNPKRSLKQNNRYWALLTVGATSLWEDPGMKDSLHEELAHLYFGLPPCPKTGIRRRKRTPQAETPEFGRYMDWCAGKLIEYGADLSSWDEEARKVEAA